MAAAAERRYARRASSMLLLRGVRIQSDQKSQRERERVEKVCDLTRVRDQARSHDLTCTLERAARDDNLQRLIAAGHMT